ncbi:MAG: hypothetical protein ACXACG_18060 [Candidatus Thorarchaeota archaeon]|jgi:hypothetical protein
MKTASFQTLLEDLKISIRFALRNVISYVLAIIGVFLVTIILIAMVAAFVFIPMVFSPGVFEAFTIWAEAFTELGTASGVSIATGIFLIALPFVAPFFVATGALFGMAREIVESDGTSAEGVFTWYKKKFFSLAGGGIMLFLFILGPVMLVILGTVFLFGEQVLNVAFIGIGTTTTMNPLISALGVIWFTISTGLMTMLFPAIIDGYSVIEATKRSIRMGIQYFDRVFGAWISYILVILVLVVPLIFVPFTMGTFEPALMMIAVYAIPMGLIIAFVLLPAVSIGLTRIYMILTADDDELILHEDEDEGGPSFIGGL